MNIIVSNKQKEIIDNANIDAIKDLNGLFNVDDLLGKLKNYFFSRVILDATSLINFTSDEVLQKLVDNIGGERLFILLPAVPEPPKEFVDKLLNLKIYNFSNKINELVSFISNPKSDVSNLNENLSNGFYVDSSVKEEDTTNQGDVSLSSAIDAMSINSGESVVTNNEPTTNYSADLSNMFSSVNVDNSFPVTNNFESNNMPITEDRPISDNNMFLHRNLNVTSSGEKSNVKTVIGFKNVTDHAGSTSLIYMLLKTIESVYHKKAIAIEIDSDNFKYYQSNSMFSVSSNNIMNSINTWDADIVLVDLNGYDNLSICNDVLYLVEPSIIRLNKLMMGDNEAFTKLSGKKVILNMSFLDDNDVMAFSKEAGMPMFYNIPPLNDRVSNNVLCGLLDKLVIK